MQASERVLARRYAQALFETAVPAAPGAKGSEEAERMRQELSGSVRALAVRMRVFQHPALGAARKKAVLKDLIGKQASPRTLRLLELLVEKRRFHLLPLVAAEYGRLLDERLGIVRATVRSASELSAQEVARLRRALEAFSGKEVAVSIQAAPELLGGVVVRMGDWVLDGSLKGQLERLKAHLAAAA